MNTLTTPEIAAVRVLVDEQAAQPKTPVHALPEETPPPAAGTGTPAHRQRESDSAEPAFEVKPGRLSTQVGAQLRFIPLSQLRVSRRNVRKTHITPVSVAALAQSIRRVGLLQNLIVIAAADGVQGEVAGGKRRLAALRLLAKQKHLSKEQAIPCLVVPDDSAVTVSLTENVQREAMHPADQFEAFKALVDEGRPIEDIAADFGVTPLVVQRRLKLANVSPRLLADYRADAITLEQLMALAITDDHATQEAAFYDAPQWEREAHALRRRLTETEVEATRSPLARFVGMDVYREAGGAIRRDLFAEDDNGVYLSDTALLHRLTMEKLDALAADLQREGWKWVEAVPSLGYSELASYRRVQPVHRAPTVRQAKRLVKLEAEQARIEAALHEAEDSEDEDAAQALYEQSDAVEQALGVFYESLRAYTSETMALAGAVVTVDRDGAPVVHRGLVRPEDASAVAKAQHGQNAGGEPCGAAQEGEDEEDQGSRARKSLSDRLTRQLSAHRSAALQAELAKQPDVALVVLAHRLALSVFYQEYGQSVLHLSATPQDGLDAHDAEVGEGRALAEFTALRRAWQERLPTDGEALFEALQQLDRADLLALLGVCTASTVNAVTANEHDTRADALARAVGLDMRAYWTPTAQGYFDHVSKTQILEAFKVFKPSEINRVAGYKKAAMAAEAALHSVGSGWLPAMLRAKP